MRPDDDTSGLDGAAVGHRFGDDAFIGSHGFGAFAGAEDEARHRMLAYFYKADADYGRGLTRVAGGDLKRVEARAAQLQD